MKPFVRFRMRWPYDQNDGDDMRFAIAPRGESMTVVDWWDEAGITRHNGDPWWPVNGRESEVGRG